MAMLLVWVGRPIGIAIAIHLQEIDSTLPKGAMGQVLMKLARSKNVKIYNDTDRQWTNLDQKKLVKKLLRWYGTPCNIYNDGRILKYDYNHSFKNFKIYNMCPKNAFYKIPQERQKVKLVHDLNPIPTDC